MGNWNIYYKIKFTWKKYFIYKTIENVWRKNFNDKKEKYSWKNKKIEINKRQKETRNFLIKINSTKNSILKTVSLPKKTKTLNNFWKKFQVCLLLLNQLFTIGILPFQMSRLWYTRSLCIRKYISYFIIWNIEL